MSILPPLPKDDAELPDVCVDSREADKAAATDFMARMGSWIVQSKPGPVDAGTEKTVREAAEADAAKVPIFMAAVMRKKILFVIQLWDALEIAFEKLTDPDEIRGMDPEDVGVLFDRLCREESRNMDSLMKLKGVIEGIDWASIESIVKGETRISASARLPAKDREAFRKVFMRALTNPAEGQDYDPEVDGPGLDGEEPPVDAEFEVTGE